ncbi:MAG: hypothetical protein ABIG93_05325 [archaeon]
MSRKKDYNSVKKVTRDGREVHILSEGRSVGSLSSRFFIELGRERMFWKTHSNNITCPGPTSITLLLNEMSVEDTIKEYSSKMDHNQILAEFGKREYLGSMEIDGRMGLLFKDLSRGHAYFQTLEEIIELPDYSKRNNVKPEEIKANNYKILKLDKVVNLTESILKQVKFFHNFKTPICSGIIHGDLSPANIIVIDRNIFLVNDFGIARSKGEDIRHLFNKSVAGPVSNTYYTSGNRGIFNVIYSSPDIESYEKAEPSIDTYFMANNLCLMLTGRLSQYWINKAKEVQNKKDLNHLRESLLESLDGDRKDDKNYSDENAEKLVDIIIKGTSGKDERYQEAQDFIDDLKEINLELEVTTDPSPQEISIFGSDGPQIPDEIKNYIIKLPNYNCGEEILFYSNQINNFPLPQNTKKNIGQIEKQDFSLDWLREKIISEKEISKKNYAKILINDCFNGISNQGRRVYNFCEEGIESAIWGLQQKISAVKEFTLIFDWKTIALLTTVATGIISGGFVTKYMVEHKGELFDDQKTEEVIPKQLINNTGQEEITQETSNYNVEIDPEQKSLELPSQEPTPAEIELRKQIHNLHPRLADVVIEDFYLNKDGNIMNYDDGSSGVYKIDRNNNLTFHDKDINGSDYYNILKDSSTHWEVFKPSHDYFLRERLYSLHPEFGLNIINNFYFDNENNIRCKGDNDKGVYFLEDDGDLLYNCNCPNGNKISSIKKKGSCGWVNQ